MYADLTTRRSIPRHAFSPGIRSLGLCMQGRIERGVSLCLQPTPFAYILTVK